MDYVIGKGVGFSVFASLGNEADINETDLIEHLADDPNTKVIAAYVEAINHGQHFIEVAKKVTRKKPIVILEIRTHAGWCALGFLTYRFASRGTQRLCGCLQAKRCD